MLANIKFKAIEDLKNLRANEGEEMDIIEVNETRTFRKN